MKSRNHELTPAHDLWKFLQFTRSRNMLVRIICIVAILIVTSQAAFGMDFGFRPYDWKRNDPRINSKDKDELYMTGEIRRGDYEKFRKFILENLDDYSSSGRYVSISSNGGDLVETLKIATILKAMYATVEIERGSKCASSCFFLYLSGIKRVTEGKETLGIHRAYFDSSYFSGLSPREAEKRQSELERTVAAILEINSVPRSIIERMNRTSSAEIYWLNGKEESELGWMSTWYEEFLIAKCGYDTTIDPFDFMKEGYDFKKEWERWNANYVKVRDCEDKFITPELKKLSNLLQTPEPTKNSQPSKRTKKANH